MPDKSSQLAVIADNLDRIVPFSKDGGKRSNLDEIFLDRTEQLKALDCHVIYTIPISMVYSNRATELINNYNDPASVADDYGTAIPRRINEAGLAKIKELIEKRVKQVLRIYL